MALTDRYHKPADLPPRLAVFPLRGAILLPRATLPLNVFEPRYLAMIDDAMAGSRVIGIIQPEGRDDTDESPIAPTANLRRVGCAGRITSYQETDDERLIVTLTGIARFEIIDEALTAKPYRTVSASYDRFAQDLCEGLGEDMVDRANLLRVLKT